MADSHESPAQRRLDLVVGWILIGTTVLIALIVHTVFFEYKTWIGGDISYHRGVALTMQGSTLQGEGPYAGLISYFGGLYPLALAGLSLLGGWEVNSVVSVLSWPLALAIPAAFAYLAWRMWPGRWLVVGVITSIGALATPLSTKRTDLWVESIVPSGQNFWPVYPRDLALAAVIVAIGSVTLPKHMSRIVVLGALIGLTVAVHAQLGVVGAMLVAAAYLAYRRESPLASSLRDLVLVAAVAVGVSAWWWVPRLAATIESSRLLLASYPLRLPFVLTPAGYVTHFGLIGVIGLAGLAMGARRRSDVWRVSVAMLTVLLSLVVVARIGGDLGVLTERRVWLLASIPLIMLGGVLVESAKTWTRSLILALSMIGLLIASSLAPTMATVDWIDSSFSPQNQWGQAWDLDEWAPVWSDLNETVRMEGRPTVITYDAYSLAAWSMSGVRVHGSWLPGPVKLGFDPESLTGRSYLDRVADVRGSFLEGRSGICNLADDVGASVFLLDVRGGSLGLWDSWVAAEYRVDPGKRSLASIERTVAGGVTYVDRNGYDALQLDAGAVYVSDIDFDTEMGVVAVGFRLPSDSDEPVLEMRVGSETYTVTGGDRMYNRVSTDSFVGQTGPVQIIAQQRVELLRITTFEENPSLETNIDGVVVLDNSELCQPGRD